MKFELTVTMKGGQKLVEAQFEAEQAEAEKIALAMDLRPCPWGLNYDIRQVTEPAHALAR